jgi:hypothetical protein
VSNSIASVRNCRRKVAVALLSSVVVTGWLIAVPTSVAHADCTGSDFGAGSGCPPPDDSSGSGGSGGGESWPPTAVDWPPSQSSDSGGGGGGKGKAATPIVLPDGQTAPSVKPSSGTSDSDDTSTPPTPIVPVGSVSAGPTPTVIVAPIASTP